MHTYDYTPLYGVPEKAWPPKVTAGVFYCLFSGKLCDVY